MVFSDQRVQVHSTKEACGFEGTVVASTVRRLMSVAFVPQCLIGCVKRSEQRWTRPPSCGSGSEPGTWRRCRPPAWALVEARKSRVAAGSRGQARPRPDHRSFPAELARAGRVDEGLWARHAGGSPRAQDMLPKRRTWAHPTCPTLGMSPQQAVCVPGVMEGQV